MGLAYGSSPGFENWDPNADLNGDGVINIYDLALASKDGPSGKEENIYTPLQGGTPTISVKPVSTTILVGQNFSIDVNVTYALETYAWEFYLNWNSSLINVVEPNVTEGEFLDPYGNLSTYFSYFFNQTEGWMIVGCTLYEQPAILPSGSGKLATIHFTTLDLGSSMLDLNDTKLLNDTLDNYTHESSDGTVDVVGCLNDGHCGFCEECSVSNTCVNATFGTDPKLECPADACKYGYCDGFRACAMKPDTTDCGTCALCDGLGNCNVFDETQDEDCLALGDCGHCTGIDNCDANETVCELKYCADCRGSGNNWNCGYDENEDEDCPTCQVCAALDACSYAPNGTDPKLECPADACKYGYCDGSGACKYKPDTTDCGRCALCNGFGSCNVYDNTQDEDCGFCEECSGLNSCGLAPFGTDPKDDCSGNCGVCNGTYHECARDQSLCTGDCAWCWPYTPNASAYNCGANETDCELRYCADCTGSGTSFSCVYDPGEDEDCDRFDYLGGVARCDYWPDGNPYTWDYAEPFDSVCAGLDQCTQGNTTITHTCADNNLTDTVPLGGCGAECDENSDCVCDVCFSNCTCLILLADLNDDRGVNILDLIIVGNAFGSKPGDPRWNSTADIYGPGKVPDGIVNVYDLSLVGKKFGDEC